MKRIVLWLVAIGLFSVTFTVGDRQIRIAPREGTTFELPENATWRVPSSPFRVGTYNIRRSKGLDDVRDIRRTAEVIRSESDIVGLQELSGSLFYGWHDQAHQLGHILGTGFLYAPTRWRWYQRYDGIGLLSRFPIKCWSIEGLPHRDVPKAYYRNLITTVVEIDGVEVTVLNTHLNRHETHTEQLEYIKGKFRAAATPAVLVGDLNNDLTDPVFQELLNDEDVKDPLGTILGDYWTLDWILVRGLDIVNAGVVEPGVSDHPYVWADLSVPKPGVMTRQSSCPVNL